MSGFNAGMYANLTRAQLRTQAMFLVAGGVISSYFGVVSQAVPAAMSQILRRHGPILGDPGADSGAKNWAEKHKSFLAPIRRQNGGDRLELVW